MSLSDLIAGKSARKIPNFSPANDTQELAQLAELAFAAPKRETTAGDERLAFPSLVTNTATVTSELGKHSSHTELAKLSGLALANPNSHLHDQVMRLESVKPPATRYAKEIVDSAFASNFFEVMSTNQTLSSSSLKVNSVTNLANANHANSANNDEQKAPSLMAEDTVTARRWEVHFSDREPSKICSNPSAADLQSLQDLVGATDSHELNSAQVKHEIAARQEANHLTKRRTIMIESRRIASAEASRLAARLLERDQDLDDRKMCIECTQLVGNYCRSSLEPIGGGRTVLHRCIKFLEDSHDRTA